MVEIASAAPEPIVGIRSISEISHVIVPQIGHDRQRRNSLRSSGEMPGREDHQTMAGDAVTAG